MHRIILIVLLLFTTSSFATELTDLYQSQLAVENQQESEQQRVLPDILHQVLLKVVGNRAILDAANLKPVLAKASSLIQQTQYRRVATITDDLTQSEQLVLSLSFDEVGVNQALTDNGLPIWSKSRPDVMVWLAIDDGQTQHILAADDNTIYSKIVKETAERRGLPIVLPIMDLQDQISVNDIESEKSDAIKQASQRYGANVILLARIAVSANDEVQIEWQSIINDASEKWQSKGKTRTALSAGIETFTDRLAQDFTQVLTQQSDNVTSTLEISNVQDYADYSRTMTYLASLQYVSDLEMVKLEENTLTVILQIEGDKTVFIRTLAIEHIIEAVGDDNTADIMHYRLLP